MGEVYHRIPDWRHDAACRDENPELFFPIGDTGPSLLQTEEAKLVCQRCPVIYDCLKLALTTDMAGFGVWGGMSENERRELRKDPEEVKKVLATVAIQQHNDEVLLKQG